MNHRFSFDYFGATIQAQSLGNKTVPALEETLTAHVVPITNDGKVVAVDVIGRGVDIPGGHIDAGESAIEAATREAYEEALIEVVDLQLVDVLRLQSDDETLGLKTKPYMVLYASRVGRFDTFIVNSEVSERLIIDRQEFARRYFADSAYAVDLIDKALHALTLKPDGQ